MKNPSRAEIWMIEFEPAVGAEIHKLHPGVVLSLSKFGHLPLRMAVPITEYKPWHDNHEWFELLEPSKANGFAKMRSADSFQCKSLSIAIVLFERWANLHRTKQKVLSSELFSV